MRRLFCDGKPTVGCTPSPFTTARGTNQKTWRRLRLYENRFSRRLHSSLTWSGKPQAFGSQSAQRCSVTKCSSIWNFISSRYFKKIIDDLTSDLPGVAVYLDDILVSGKDVKDHYHNLQRLLDCLHTQGLRCKREKCCFAQPQFEYSGHMLKRDDIHKGHKVDVVLNMPAPSDATSLKSFLGSVQFCAKFLPPSYATKAEPLYRLTKKDVE